MHEENNENSWRLSQDSRQILSLVNRMRYGTCDMKEK